MRADDWILKVRLSGQISSWNDDRGYGFVAPSQGGAELFMHISALPRDGSRPTVGETVTYELGRGKNGQPQAVNVVRTAIGPAGGRSRSAARGAARVFIFFENRRDPGGRGARRLWLFLLCHKHYNTSFVILHWRNDGCRRAL